MNQKYWCKTSWNNNSFERRHIVSSCFFFISSGDCMTRGIEFRNKLLGLCYCFGEYRKLRYFSPYRLIITTRPFAVTTTSYSMFLICFLCYLSGLAENIKFSNSPLFFPTKIEERIRLFERDLSYSKQRLNIFQDTIGTVLKPRRAAIDLGGSSTQMAFWFRHTGRSGKHQ